ncbi:MAG: helix-turn-helix domain-containing protein [Micrococcales bacterium]|nr:helix-turn-helix domain-containing protein [Micrococcales bacterium]
MSHDLITLSPEDVRRDASAALPGWAVRVVEQIRRAAASGQTVTVVSEEQMLSPEQVAQRLNMHRSTVVRKITAGQIQAVKVGNRHRVPYSEFLRYQDVVLGALARAAGPEIEAELFGDE